MKQKEEKIVPHFEENLLKLKTNNFIIKKYVYNEKVKVREKRV
jgi:hypothetical protein